MQGGACTHATVVLTGVSFTAPPGRVTALVRPSGAGKTTIARLITRAARTLLHVVAAGELSDCACTVPDIPAGTLVIPVSGRDSLLVAILAQVSRRSEWRST